MNIVSISVEKNLSSIIDVLVAALFALDREYAAAQCVPKAQTTSRIKRCMATKLAPSR